MLYPLKGCNYVHTHDIIDYIYQLVNTELDYCVLLYVLLSRGLLGFMANNMRHYKDTGWAWMVLLGEHVMLFALLL